MDRRKGFDLYHTEIVIIRKEVCPTSKFENIDQVTFKMCGKMSIIYNFIRLLTVQHHLRGKGRRPYPNCHA